MPRGAAALTALLLCAAVAMAAAGDSYSSKYDGVDVDAILRNDRLLDTYVKCLKDEVDTKCTPDGKALKGVLKEALATDCEKCTARQKEIVAKVIPFLQEKKPDAWAELASKFDPEGEYARRHGDA